MVTASRAQPRRAGRNHTTDSWKTGFEEGRGKSPLSPFVLTTGYFPLPQTIPGLGHTEAGYPGEQETGPSAGPRSQTEVLKTLLLTSRQQVNPRPEMPENFQRKLKKKNKKQPTNKKPAILARHGPSSRSGLGRHMCLHSTLWRPGELLTLLSPAAPLSQNWHSAPIALNNVWPAGGKHATTLTAAFCDLSRGRSLL